MLKKIIEQELLRVEEDYLVDPSKVSPNFAYTSREEDVCPECEKSPCVCDDFGDACPTCGMNPCRCIVGNKNSSISNKSPYKLSCDSCGGVLVMQEGCGCGGSKELSPRSIYMNVLDGMEDMNGHYENDYFEEEADEHHDGAYMAKSQLHMIEEYAKMLQQMIPDGDDLDDWMRSHISQAADDLSEVYHNLEYKNHKDF
jgi:hypothetical protein